MRISSVLDTQHLDERNRVAVHLAFLQFGFALPVADFRVGFPGQLRAVLLEREGVFLVADLRVEFGFPCAGDVGGESLRGWRGRPRPCGGRLRDDFNRVNFRVLDLALESNAEFPVGHFHGHRFDVGAIGAARLGPNVEILELAPLHVVGEHALAGAGNALERLRKVEFRQYLPLGSLQEKDSIE